MKIQTFLTLIISSIMGSVILQDIPKSIAASSITLGVAEVFETHKKRTRNRLICPKLNSATAEPSCVLYWDYQNVNTLNIQVINDHIKQLGCLSVKRVYASWETVPKATSQKFAELGFEQIQISLKKSNSLDFKITNDCLCDSINGQKVQEVIIIAGDQDYLSLVHQLQQQLNKRVTIIASSKNASTILINSADTFIDIDDWLKAIPPLINSSTSPAQNLLTIDQTTQYLIEAILMANRLGKLSSPALIGLLMRQISKNKFSGVKSIASINGKSFKRLTDFLEYLESQGIVHLSDTDSQALIYLNTSNPNSVIRISEHLQPLYQYRQNSSVISLEDWEMLLNQLNITFANEAVASSSDSVELGFMALLYPLRQTKREEGFHSSYSVKTLSNALSQLIEAGLLIRQENNLYLQSPNWDSGCISFLENLCPEFNLGLTTH
jgi:hypothetical protein